MRFIFLFMLCTLVLFVIWHVHQRFDTCDARMPINCVDNIESLFPRSKDAVEQLLQKTEQDVTKRLEKIYSYKPHERTFANTMCALDSIHELITVTGASLDVLAMASSEAEMRDACREAILKLDGFVIDHIALNPRLYQACLEYETLMKDPHSKERLDSVERYFVEKTMEAMDRNGLKLPQKEQEEVKKIYKELAEVTIAFDKNIADDKRFIEVPLEGLQGLSEGFSNSLYRSPEGLYRLKVDNPTYGEVLDECAVEQTRKLLYKQYFQRGYPANEPLLERMISLRDRLAHLLGYPSYAHYDIADQMAKTPEAVEAFLSDIEKRVQTKIAQEIDLLKKNLPAGVSLTPDGLFYPWDFRYMQTQYKKSHDDLDEKRIAEYFPLEHSLEALLKIYESFFGLQFKPVECAHLWDKDVRCRAVYKGGCYYGVVILDLFPRDNKFTHAAKLTVVPSVKNNKGLFPAVVFLVANFPRARADQPALLTRKDLTTFFHEFGHVLHAVLGSTKLASFSGTNVKGDFVEMPSQMLEEWIEDQQVLKMVSKHYKTGEPLPDDLIEKIQKAKNLFSGDQITRLLFYSWISLSYFLPGAHKDIVALWKDYYTRQFPFLYYDEDNRGYCAFLHLPPYGSKYYGYLWSKVYAMDLFYTIKPHGLLNPHIGSRYSDQVIGKGGSEDPAELLRTFLGREPRSDAFFEDLGLESTKEVHSAAAE